MTTNFSFMENFGCFSRDKISLQESNTVQQQHFLDSKGSIQEPLTCNFFVNLLELEEKFTNKETSIKIINELTLFYARLIEYYDHKEDPIKFYFSEKLEGIYSNHTTLRLLRKNKNIKNACRGSLGCVDNFQIEGLTEKLNSRFELGVYQFESEENLTNNTNDRPKSKSIQQKKHERQKKRKILLELENKKENEIEETSKLMVNFIEKSVKNDDVVKMDLKKQMQNINEKINKKRNLFGSSFGESNMNSFSYGANSFSYAADSKDNFENYTPKSTFQVILS